MEKEKCFSEILKHLKNGRVSLFLGAGTSCATGLPSGFELSKRIKEKFPNINKELNDFMEICLDVIDTPPYTRDELEEFIKNELQGVKPSESHLKMTKFNWSSLFTTNYDDIIEIAYSTSENKLKSCQDIYQNNYSINISDRNKMYLFKLMGTTRATDKDGQMVLTRIDYLHSYQVRQNYLKTVFDFIKNGTMVFIGYSFGDQLARDIIDEIIKTYTLDRLPYSYAIFADDVKEDEKTKHYFASRKIIPIKSNFEEFIGYIDNNYKKPIEKTSNVSLKIKDQLIEIDEEKYTQYLDCFDFLTNEKINEDSGKKDDFFKGTNKSWGPFREKWAFERIIRNNKGEILEDIVSEKLKKEGTDFNEILLLTGMAGCGKSTIAKNIAFKSFYNDGNLIIYFPSSIKNIDYRLLADFIELINEKYVEQSKKYEHFKVVKPLIVIDDASSFMKHIIRIKDYLTSRGRSILILAVERENEWTLRSKEFPIELSENNIFRINETLSDEEVNQIVKHFYKLGYLTFESDEIVKNIKDNLESSFFATVYSNVHESRKPLDEIIKDQFITLSELSKKAFTYVCSFSQYNIPLNMELLVRAIGCDYNVFINDILKSDALKVIFEEFDENGNIFYRAHHRIIAKNTLDIFFPDTSIQKEIFLDIFNSTNLSNIKEREIIEKILIGYLSNKSGLTKFNNNQIRDFFVAICSVYRTRSLLHHWGLLEEDCGDYQKAEELYKNALELQRDFFESFKGESDQNILTSLGTLLSKKGNDLLKKGINHKANECFKEAENYFKNAKHGEYPNAHAYHSHANMWLNRGKQEKTNELKMYDFAKALEIISLAKDNINEEELIALSDLETQIWLEIGNEENIKRCALSISKNHKSPRGYYLSAQYKFRNAIINDRINRIELEASLKIINESLKEYPNDEFCLALKCKIWNKLYQDEINDYYKNLYDWYLNSLSKNVNLLFDLGRIAFIKEFYELSEKIFDELQMYIGQGHKYRSVPRNPIKEYNKAKIYEGTIRFIKNRFRGFISCDNLINLKSLIPFNPVACGFTPNIGDFVRYNIYFSFRGPRAENIKKL
jgi:tetratricopeptide (TPR) repeat protein